MNGRLKGKLSSRISACTHHLLYDCICQGEGHQIVRRLVVRTCCWKALSYLLCLLEFGTESSSLSLSSASALASFPSSECLTRFGLRPYLQQLDQLCQHQFLHLYSILCLTPTRRAGKFSRYRLTKDFGQTMSQCAMCGFTARRPLVHEATGCLYP